MTQENQCPITTTESPEQHGSQVAACLASIEAEYRASQMALHGYTATARHCYITARMENMGTLAEQLTEMVGGDKDQAMCLVIGCMQMVEGEQQSHA